MRYLVAFLFAALSLNAVGQVPNYVPSDGLVAWYPFNGDANDESGNGNDGTVTGTILDIDRFNVPNSCYSFDGNDQIEVLNEFYNNGWEEYTFSIWFKTSSANQTMQALFNTIPHDGEGLGWNHENALSKISHSKNSDTAYHLWDILSAHPLVNNSVEENSWTHVVIVKHGLTYSYYINSGFDNQVTTSISALQQFTGIRFGSIGSSEFLLGSLDDIGIWNRALSEEEILELYNYQVLMSGCTDTIACNFNEIAVEDDGSCEYITPVDLGEDVTTCGDSVTLDAGEGYDSYLWSNGETTQSIDVSESGEYGVETNNSSNDVGINFNGTGKYIEINSPLEINVGYSISATLEFPLPDTFCGQTMYSHNVIAGAADEGKHFFSIWGNNKEIAIYDDNGSCQPITDCWYSSGYSVEGIEGWHTISIISNGQISTFYLDGEQVGTSVNHSVTGFLKYIGNYTPDYYQGCEWTGNMAEIKFWNNEISFEDLNLCINTPFLYWDFEDVNSSEITDQINENNGTLYNADTSQNTINLDCFSANNCSSSDDITVTINPSGCTDSSACNFNGEAICDDGSCEYITPVDLGEDITTCDESVTLDAGEGYDSYLWSNGETTQSIEVSESGGYSVEVGNGSENNYSMSFDGVDDYVDAGNCNFLPNTSITIATWLKSTNDLNIDVGDIFVSDVSWSTYTVRLGTNGALSFRIQPNAGSGGNVVSVNTISNGYNYADSIWHHLACTWDGDSISIYVDGTQVGPSLQTNFNSVSFTNDNATIGSYPTTNLAFFNGKLDDFHILDYALSEADIQQYMSCPPTGGEDGLVGYWNFEEASGETAFDQTGNGNDGTINGATWSSETPEQTCSFCSSSDEITVTINICGCTDSEAVNYNLEANQDDSSCCYDIDYVNDTYDDGYAEGVDSVLCPENNCPADLDDNGYVSTSDLLIFLTQFGTICE